MITIEDRAEWRGDVLELVSHYNYPEKRVTTHRMARVEIGGVNDTYWVSADGQCFAIQPLTDTCLAVVETAILLAGAKGVYATHRRAATGVKAWVKKWSKITTSPEYHPFVTRSVYVKAA